MAPGHWQTKDVSVRNLHPDVQNPRLSPELRGASPRELIQYMFDHYGALDVATSIARRGYFANEPLLAVKENGRLVVVEGNRRLAALKALRQPGIIDGQHSRAVARLAAQVADPAALTAVPVTLAPSRRATDQLLAGRHVGTPVLPWRAENRARFILEKLDEGYDADQLKAELGFSAADILSAQQTRAIATMVRALPLAPEVRKKIEWTCTGLTDTQDRACSPGRMSEWNRQDDVHGVRSRTSTRRK